jgi:tetratricopeptide (TPR) repeat protein
MSANRDPGQYARLKSAYFELEALTAHQRAARIAEIAAGDADFAAALRKRFEPASGRAGILDRAERTESSDAVPQVPHYRMIRELGRGGMGRVWLAERALDDARQLVAFKHMLHSHWDDEDLRRFQRERRILATLDHPHIAALIDGGRDASGAPYLATSYVDGQPLDRWCREHMVSVRERVRLLRDVAAAVAYAHRRLVVHRDLKPANILVTADGTPRLLDFGIARLLGEEAITSTGPSQMTLRYASPEQVQVGSGEIGVGVDIYALGVLLYELAAGTSPYGEQATTAALLRAILEHEPMPPTSLGAPGGTRDRDLDAIALRALRKRAEDRYASADALVADLDCWLRREPVAARRGERGYRLRTFLRRYWVALTTAAAVTIGALLFLGYHLQRLDRQLADTQRERDKARAIASYFQELFASGNPGDARSGELTARELLARSVARLEQGDTSTLDDDARASMYHAAGRIMHIQGLNDEAARMFDRAAELWLQQKQVPEDELADAWHERSRIEFGKGRYEASLQLLKRALARRQAMGDDRSVVLGVLLQTTAISERMLGRYPEASSTLAQAIDVLRHGLPESQSNYAIAIGNLGAILIYGGKVGEGHAKLQEGLAELRKLVPERTPALLSMERNYAMSLRELGRYDEAEQAYLANLDRLRSFYGPDHAEVARTQHSLAQQYLIQGRLDEAGLALDAAERIERATGDAGNPRMLAYRADRARVLIARGEFAAARQLLDEVLAKRADAAISERSNVGAERVALAYAACRAEPQAGHLPILQQAVAAMRNDPPLPGALMGMAEDWVGQCASRSGAAG